MKTQEDEKKEKKKKRKKKKKKKEEKKKKEYNFGYVKVVGDLLQLSQKMDEVEVF